MVCTGNILSIVKHVHITLNFGLKWEEIGKSLYSHRGHILLVPESKQICVWHQNIQPKLID